MSIKISYSSELMSNYMQAETVAPDSKFEAMQTNDGHSLLFSIGTDGKFYLTEEMPGQGTGWQKSDLTNTITPFFPPGSAIVAKTFATGQNTTTNKFSVVLAVTVSGADYLFVATGYTRNADDTISLSWSLMAYDATGRTASPLNIANLYVLQTATVPLIVADIVPPGRTTVDRYYIDSTNLVSQQHWNLYTLPLNMDAQTVTLRGGRKSGEYVDGIYTLGTVAGTASVYYQQIYNPYDPAMAGATNQFQFPNPATPIAIASTPSAATHGTGVTYTDLYTCTQEGDLYFFAATNQKNHAQGSLVMNNDLFSEAVSLYAYTGTQNVVVWGLNRSQQIFYTQCPLGRVADPAAWSYPVPIAEQVEQIAPYLNRINGGNTFFAHIGANTLKKVFQDPASTCWTYQDIQLSVDPQTPAQKFDCYMTRVTVTDSANAPLTAASIEVASAYRVPVYINNHYYVLDTVPIAIPTDSQGGIKIVQPVLNMLGACLTIQDPGGTNRLVINPMDNAVKQVATLNTAAALQSAEVTDDRGAPVKPLIPAGTSEDDLNAAAASIQSLCDAYGTYSPSTSAGTTTPSAKKAAPGAQPRIYTIGMHHNTMQLSVVSDVGDALSDIGNAIVVAAGDLCSWLRSAKDYVIQIIEDTAQKIWNFVATIAGKVYTFVIDTLEKVIAALEAIFPALMALIEDVVQFLKFLFSWDDITRTKDVMHNMILMYLNYGVEKVAGLKPTINQELLNLMDMINEWAGIPPASSNAAFADKPINYAQSQTDYDGVYTSPNTYLQDHFTNNIGNASEPDNTKDALKDTIIKAIQVFVEALQNEAAVVMAAGQQFHDQLLEDDKYKSMSLGEILKISTAIIANSVLATAGVVIDALIDLLVTVLNGLIDFLTAPIWIPVVSDILAGIFGFEFQFSLLDIICLVGAIPATLVYKLMKQQAPFTEDDGYSTQIIEATDLESLQAALGSGSETDPSQEFSSTIWLPENAKDTIFVVAHTFSGTAAIVNSVLILTEDVLQLPNVPYITPARQLASLVQSASYTAAGLFAKPYPIQNKAVAELSSAITYCTMASSVIFGIAPKMAKTEVTKSGIAYAQAITTILLNMTAIAPVAYHFVELAETDSNNFRTLAIIDESARMCNYFSGIGAGVAKFDVEPVTSTVIAGLSSAIAFCNGSLQIAESIVDDPQ